MKWNFKKEKEEYLYHFTNCDTAIFKILPTGKLRLNDFTKTNDPREYKSFGFGGINGNFDESNYLEEFIAAQESISKRLKDNCKVLCFCEDYYIDDEWWDGFNLPRMWFQYGENHKGVCLQIDKKKFIAENEDLINRDLTFFKEIEYTNKNKYPFINFKEIEDDSDSYLKGFIKANHRHLYFQKNRDWETEHEVRLIQFSATDTYYSIKESLNNVILGLGFEKKKLQLLLKQMDSAKLRKADYDDGMIKYFRFRKEFIEDVAKGN
jgi:hypothetical protein